MTDFDDKILLWSRQWEKLAAAVMVKHFIVLAYKEGSVDAIKSRLVQFTK